jgi:nuclear transcription Y subunit beta
MKQSLPSDTKISKEARECVQECVSEFIAFITCEACEITNAEKRKTINGEDILKSMADLNFEEYISNVDYYNKKYQEMLKKTSGKQGTSSVAIDDS